jgi:collagenase-like PrtC family protease
MHIIKTEEKVNKNSHTLTRLAGEKRGCSMDTINKTYKTYVKPIITYEAESLVTAKYITMHKLETIQNRMLRLVTGAVRTTNTTAMRMYTGNHLVQNEIEKKACTMCMKLAALLATL